MNPAANRKGQLARATQIATVLSGSGLGWLVQAMGLRGCASPRCRLICALRPGRKCPHHLEADVSLPDRLRLTIERLGPAFVKAGQMLALRPDYVPLDYAEALRGLHTGAEPFAAAEAAAIVDAGADYRIPGRAATGSRGRHAAGRPRSRGGTARRSRGDAAPGFSVRPLPR